MIDKSLLSFFLDRQGQGETWDTREIFIDQIYFRLGETLWGRGAQG